MGIHEPPELPDQDAEPDETVSKEVVLWAPVRPGSATSSAPGFAKPDELDALVDGGILERLARRGDEQLSITAAPEAIATPEATARPASGTGWRRKLLLAVVIAGLAIAISGGAVRLGGVPQGIQAGVPDEAGTDDRSRSGGSKVHADQRDDRRAGDSSQSPTATPSTPAESGGAGGSDPDPGPGPTRTDGHGRPTRPPATPSPSASPSKSPSASPSEDGGGGDKGDGDHGGG